MPHGLATVFWIRGERGVFSHEQGHRAAWVFGRPLTADVMPSATWQTPLTPLTASKTVVEARPIQGLPQVKWAGPTKAH